MRAPGRAGGGPSRRERDGLREDAAGGALDGLQALHRDPLGLVGRDPQCAQRCRRRLLGEVAFAARIEHAVRRAEHGTGDDVQGQGDRHAREAALADALAEIAPHEVQQDVRPAHVRPAEPDQEGSDLGVIDRGARHQPDAAGYALRRVVEAQHHRFGHPDQLVRDLRRDLAQQRLGRRDILGEAAPRDLGTDDDIIDRDRGRPLLGAESNSGTQQAQTHAFPPFGGDSGAVILDWHRGVEGQTRRVDHTLIVMMTITSS